MKLLDLYQLQDRDWVTCKIQGERLILLFFFFKFSNALYILLEEAMAPHSSTLAWKIPWTGEPGGLQSMGSLGVGHD